MARVWICCTFGWRGPFDTAELALAAYQNACVSAAETPRKLPTKRRLFDDAEPEALEVSSSGRALRKPARFE